VSDGLLFCLHLSYRSDSDKTEQDHRFIKKITKPMMGFKAFHSAQATIAGIETAHMIFSQALGPPSPWKVEEICFLSAPMSAQSELHIYQATIAGIETAHMIRKGQLSEDNIPAYKQFMGFCRKCEGVGAHYFSSD
jgi:transposase-like protein